MIKNGPEKPAFKIWRKGKGTGFISQFVKKVYDTSQGNPYHPFLRRSVHRSVILLNVLAEPLSTQRTG
jgi:hypothetical protein